MPTTTRSAPAASASRTAGRERRPPPYCTATPSSRVIRRRWSRLTGWPSRAPSRSTTCRKLAPASTNERGRLERIVLRRRSPSRSRPALEADRLAVADVDRREEDHAARLRPPARRSREVAEQPQAVGPRLLGVELHAVDGRPLHGAHELGAVLGGAEHVAWVGRPRGERVHVVEGARVRQALGRARDARFQATGFQPICGTFSPGASSGRPRPPAGRALGPAELGACARTAAACRGRCRASGTPASAARASSSSRPSRRTASIALRERAHAGQHDAVRAADLARGRS